MAGAWDLAKRHLQLPVFADLVWERHRSPLIAAVTVLRILKFVYVYLVFYLAFDLFDVTATCASATGAVTIEDAVNAQDVLLVMFAASAAMAACRANSLRWILLALPSGFVYLIIFVLYEFSACGQLMRDGVGDVSAIVAVVNNTLDIALTILTLVALLWMALADRAPTAHGGGTKPAAASLLEAYAAVGGDDSSGFQLARGEPANHTALEAKESAATHVGSEGASGAAAASWATRVARGAQLAPLRHRIAAVIGFVLCLAATIVLGVLGPPTATYARDKVWNPFVDTFNTVNREVNEVRSNPSIYDPLPGLVRDAIDTTISVLNSSVDPINNLGIPLVIAFHDVVTSVWLGACVSCVVVVLSMSASFAFIYDDFARLNDALPGKTRGLHMASWRDSPAPPAGNETQSLPVEAPPPTWCNRAPTFLPGTETPDVASPKFSYSLAFTYPFLYAINLVTAWFILSLVFAGLIFFCLSSLTQGYAIGVAITIGVSFAFTRLAALLVACFVARGNRVMRPRLLLLVDLALSITLGAAVGVTAGVVRFVLGCVGLIFRLTVLARPVLPGPFAGLDAGYMAHAGMVKAAWAGRLHPGSAPSEIAV